MINLSMLVQLEPAYVLTCLSKSNKLKSNILLDFLLQDKKVKKLYLALVASPVSCGIINHYMQPAKLAPRILSEGNHVNIFAVYSLNL